MEEAEQSLYARRRFNDQHASAMNGAANDAADRDAAKQVSELKLKLQESERENTNHQGNVSYLIHSSFGITEVLFLDYSIRRSGKTIKTKC